MKYRKFNIKNISLLALTFLGLSIFFLKGQILRSEERNKWQKLEPQIKNNSQYWYKVPGDKDQIYPNSIQENLSNEIIDYLLNKQKVNSTITEIDAHFPTTNFLSQGSFSSIFQWKSSFNSGQSGGIGQQNNSFKFNYGLSDSLLFSAYFSEADDHLYKKIKNRDHKTPYAWQTFAISFKKKILDSKKFNLAFNSSIEYWKVSSGSKSSISIYDENNNLGKTTHHNFISSISLPIEYKKNELLAFYVIPGINFLPDQQGSIVSSKNSYGNNFYLGAGFIYDLWENLSILSSYTYPLGPGNNYFNNNLKYSKKPIYSLGINYEASPKVEVQAKLTNSYGGTPATGILTLPSSNELLYYGGLKINHKNQDIKLNPLKSYENRLKFGGLTVSNAYLPKEGERELNLEYDSKGTFFSSYSYSISNIFQMELINIGRFKGIENHTENYNDLKSAFLNDGNSNYRIGGKMILLSPLKNNSLWLTARMTVGRNDTNNQGYLFSEIINTFNLSERLSFNLVPKLVLSGVENISGLGISLNYDLNNKIQFLPEVNINFSNFQESNSSFAIRYHYLKNKAFDIYVSNAAGLQDLGQLLKANSFKTGFKMHFYY